MYSPFYLADYEQQENFCPPAFAPIQKITAVRRAAKDANIVRGDCLGELDRPWQDLTCDAGGIAGPIYENVHPKHKKTQREQSLVWAMCCSYVITGEPVQEAQ